jgi:DNA-binding cell septation regulator SpoVG
MTMQVTEVRIYPTNEDLVSAYATIVFDNCLMIREIKVIKSTMGLFVLISCQEAERRNQQNLSGSRFSGKC